MVVDQQHAIRLPESIPLDLGGKWHSYPRTLEVLVRGLTPVALVEPLAVAWHAVSRSPLQDKDTVLVTGAGPIGLAIVQVLKARGIQTIIVVEISEQRRKFARAFGASHTLDPAQVEALAEIQSITGDACGASIAFECSGV